MTSTDVAETIERLKDEIDELREELRRSNAEHYLLMVDGELEGSFESMEHAKLMVKDLVTLGRKGRFIVIEVQGSGYVYDIDSKDL